MTHMNTVYIPSLLPQVDALQSAMASCYPTIVVVSDDFSVGSSMKCVADFLDVDFLQVPTTGDLGPILDLHRPMAVVAELDGEGQDGCHVMMVVAAYDPGLPIMLLTGHDQAQIGAAEAVEELWGLTRVTKTACLPDPGGIVEFLAHAGRLGRCLSLIPG